MAAIVVHAVSKQYGTQVVLAGVSLELRAGETVGLVGANGAGKTTLFRLLVGEQGPDSGTITCSRGLELGYLKQEPEVVLDRTLHDEIGSVFEELIALEHKLHTISEQIASHADDPKLPELMKAYERLNGRFISAGGHTFEAKLNGILGGLGFSQADHAKRMSTLSGGQKCRAAVAKLLLEDRSFLLLDEPTNHLDIDAVRWLEKYLTGHHGGSVIISHDRFLLDRLCDRIIEIENGGVATYPGNYSNYVKIKEVRLLTQQRQFEKDAEFIRKEREFIAKHLAGQRTKEAQGRRTRLERRLKAGELVTDKSKSKRKALIAFEGARAESGAVLRCDDLCMSFGENALFKDLTCQVRAGERLGITGPNGTGKTTLLRIVLGEVAATGGEFALDNKLSIGYYGQEHVELDLGRTLVDEIRVVRSEMSEQDARSYLARFLFTGDEAFKTLGMLSGGEQSRLRLASLILTEPDMLILDEPTNHLDIPSREVLEDALCGFGGTIIVVSHDRYFLDRVVDRLLVLRTTGHALYAGNYSFYIEQLERERADTKGRGSVPTKKGKPRDTVRKEARPGPSPYDRLSIDQLEEMVIEKEVQLAAIHERFGDPAIYRDLEVLAELKEQVEALEAQLAEIDAAWTERADYQ